MRIAARISSTEASLEIISSAFLLIGLAYDGIYAKRPPPVEHLLGQGKSLEGMFNCAELLPRNRVNRAF
jgi:hypothetical protein